ncbi:MAG: hypothetical protein ACH255_09340 [Candidatus Thiodiazotropha sp.]
MKYLSLVLILAFAALDNALAEKGQSIMFQPKQHPFMEPPKEADDEAAQCTQLAKRIEALKGKPQRRHAALERYRLMCTDKAQIE